jgi:hypothetical protein
MAFAHLILSGTMNDRRAAEVVGLNPDTAAYTKAKPRVRDYMIEHRAAVSQKLVDQEAEGLRKLNLGRDQILARLWELANLSPEATKGSMAGQIKALSMIVAIEGLIPNPAHARRLSPSATQPAAPTVSADSSAWRCNQEQQAPGKEPTAPAANKETQPTAPRVPGPPPEPAPKLANDMSFPNPDRNQPGILNPFINPERLNPAPAATDRVFDAVLHTGNSLRLSFSPATGFSGRLR